MSKTINQALRDLFIGLGGDVSELADNDTVSDYIEDLESAIKAVAAAELPEIEEGDNGKILKVVNGAYALANIEYTINFSANGGTGSKDPVTVIAGESFVPNSEGFTPPAENYIFAGYALSPHSTYADIVAGARFTPIGNTELYAIWIQEI